MKNLKIFTTIKQKIAKQKIWQKKWVRITFWSLVAAFCVGVASLIGLYFAVAQELPSVVNLEDRQVAESTQIYDRTGEVLLYEISGEENRTIIGEDQIPDTVKQAFISVEDQEFYNHWGVRPTAIVRAAFSNVTGRGIGGGASTITQQFVKNAILTNERTIIRKLREAILAVQVEQRYDKDEIITFYLNEIPFGGQIYGIQSASQTFFGVDTEDLEPYQAAMLAAMIQRPTYYSPYGSNFDALKARQELVLRLMRDEGYLTDEQYEEEIAKELKVQPFAQNIKAPHFVFYVREQLADEFGEEVLERGGLRVQTTLDWELQQIAERAVSEELANVSGRYDAQNAALGAIDPENGDIVAMVGSKDYFDTENDGNVNVLTSQQSPGSSIKPIVYASAFEKGYNPNTYVFDLPTNFELNPSKPAYEPNNFNLQFNGPVTFRRSLATSLNIPAVKALYLAGLDDTKEIASEMGISDYRDPANAGLAMALGGVDLQLIEHFGAYAAFPNDGEVNPLASIMEVSDGRGNILYSWKQNEKRVLKEQTARQITDVLSDNGARAPVFGFTNDLAIPGVDVAAKTGTSQEFRDALTVGYTTNLVAGVWVGKNDNSPMRNGADGSVVAAPIWNRFMREAIAVREPGTFAGPDPITTDKPMLNGSFENTEVVRVNRETGKLASENTPPELIEEREYKEVHSILYYVNRQDPLGAIPSNPAADPMFDRWEGSVRSWVEGKPEYSDTPPTEVDDVYTEDNRPSVEITSPSAEVTGNEVTVTVKATAPNSIRQVDVFLNDEAVFSSESGSFSRKISVSKEGENVLTVRAFDQFLHRGEASVTFDVTLDETSPDITSFQVTGTPVEYTLSAKVTDKSGSVQTVEFWDAVSEKRLKSLSAPTSGKDTYEFDYSPGSVGTFEFYVRAIDDSGNVSTSDTIEKP